MLPLKKYPQYSIAVQIYLSSDALIAAICLVDAFGVSVSTVTMKGLWIRDHNFIMCL